MKLFVEIAPGTISSGWIALCTKSLEFVMILSVRGPVPLLLIACCGFVSDIQIPVLSSLTHSDVCSPAGVKKIFCMIGVTKFVDCVEMLIADGAAKTDQTEIVNIMRESDVLAT
jgi:hypothetical protein